MKAKLIKTDSNYYLYVDGKIIASTEYVEGNQKLFKQNCDEIFGVVDVEKLAESHAEECYERNGDPLEESYFENRKYNFKKGFNKAMELNKDKLFTLEDMKAIFVFGHQVGMNTILAIQSQHSPQPSPKPDSDKLRDKVIQSLQQPKEIEVDIKMEPCYYDQSLGAFSTSYTEDKPKEQPKLDKNGCLILKKL